MYSRGLEVENLGILNIIIMTDVKNFHLLLYVQCTCTSTNRTVPKSKLRHGSAGLSKTYVRFIKLSNYVNNICNDYVLTQSTSSIL